MFGRTRVCSVDRPLRISRGISKIVLLTAVFAAFFHGEPLVNPTDAFSFFLFSLSDPQFLLLDFQTRIIPLDERGIEHFLLDSLIPRTRSLRYMYGILYTLDPCSWPTFVRRTRESKGKRFRGFRTTSLIYSNKLARNLENKRDI